MNKPKWLSGISFASFLAQHNRNGIIHCAACNVSERDAEMTVDHIVPRIEDGSDEPSNLQPLCRSCNSRKQARPDAYWSRKHYFDGFIDRDRLRASQNDFVMGPIDEYADFFAKPYSEINRKLFTYAQTVGAGKSLGMFALPFALNAVAKPNAPRVDKMLIVTKNIQLRDQLADEIIKEPVKYKIINESPSVITIDGSHMLGDDSIDHDIAVMCPHMLWPSIDNDGAGVVKAQWGPMTMNVMRRYPLIIFDEMHYAYSHIARLVRVATNSLVFGFTATPINSAGDLLDDMVIMSAFTYNDAQINDGSMKNIYIPNGLPVADIINDME
jgi:hypothetical protein